MKTNPKILWLAALCALVSGGSLAGPVGPLTIFTGGTPARASEVNANFSAVATAVNDNDSRITTIESRVSPAGNVVLVPSTATTGNILKGTSPFIHNFGVANTFIGLGAGNFTMTGANNTASGAAALTSNTTGFENTASGATALHNNTTGNNNIAIGNLGVPGEGDTIRIGDGQTRAFIAGIAGAAVIGAAVLVNVTGQLGIMASSRHVKDDISDMGDASSKLMKLRPVTFHYKNDRSPAGRTLQYGLVAEEVAKVAPGLVARSAGGKIETVYYQFLAPMLLNEVQKQQRTIAAQTARLEQQAGEIAELRQQMARMTQLFARLEQWEIVASAGR